MQETILIIGDAVYEKLTEKEQKEFFHYERYKYMYDRDTDGDGDWIGDSAFDNGDDLCKFAGIETLDDIDILDVYTCCYKFFDEQDDLGYFQDLAKDVKGIQVKIKLKNQGWYKRNIHDPD